MSVADIDLDALAEQLNASDEAQKRFGKMSVPELTGEIIRRYHQKELTMLSSINSVIKSLSEEEKAAAPDTFEAFVSGQGRLREMLRAHFEKEEKEVFRLMRDPRARNQKTLLLVSDLENEHGAAEQLISDIQQASGYFDLPEGVPEKIASIYSQAQELYRDIAEHVQAENGVLFPKYESLVREAMAEAETAAQGEKAAQEDSAAKAANGQSPIDSAVADSAAADSTPVGSVATDSTAADSTTADNAAADSMATDRNVPASAAEPSTAAGAKEKSGLRSFFSKLWHRGK